MRTVATLARTADHYVYRCFDADGTLLYIGCARDVKARMTSHRAERKARASRFLMAFMTRHEVEGPYAGLAAGRAAEAAAIAAEQPVFNTQERRLPISFSRNSISRYLVEHGRTDLAMELACTCWRESRDAGQRDGWCAAHEDSAIPRAG